MESMNDFQLLHLRACGSVGDLWWEQGGGSLRNCGGNRGESMEELWWDWGGVSTGDLWWEQGGCSLRSCGSRERVTEEL